MPYEVFEEVGDVKAGHCGRFPLPQEKLQVCSWRK